MEPKRQFQIECLLRSEISKIICTKMRDPLVGFVTIKNVQLSKDGRSAKVFFSVLGDNTIQKNTLKGLSRARGFIQNELKSRIQLRYHPVLNFIFAGITSNEIRSEDGSSRFQMNNSMTSI